MPEVYRSRKSEAKCCSIAQIQASEIYSSYGIAIVFYAGAASVAYRR